MTLKEQEKERKRNKGNFIALILTVSIFWIGIWYLILFYIPNRNWKNWEEKTTKIYKIKNIIKIDTIEVNNFKHEFLTIRIKEQNWGREFHDSVIHSPKCECIPFFIKYPINNENK